jgi:hypothetical protein
MKVGDEAELEVMDFLRSLGFYPYKNDNPKTRLLYDIAADHECRTITFEVKHDVMSAKTGNVALEYFNSKKGTPSGITATTADWWVHKICGELWIIKTSDLLNFTKTEKPCKMISAGGDKNADLMIYAIDRFTSNARLLSSITSIEELL